MEKRLCSNCYSVLPYSTKGFSICSQCGEVNFDQEEVQEKPKEEESTKKKLVRRKR